MNDFPGFQSKKMIEELQEYVIVEPFPFVLNLANCRGMWLETIEGQRIFDWCGYFGSKLIGHNHPRMWEPEYLSRLTVAANNKVPNPDFLTPESLEYYRLLYELSPECMKNDQLEVYVVNSGAEAVENMMKYLINLHDRKTLKRGGSLGSKRFVYFDQAFHGRTVFALNVTKLTHNPMATKDFKSFVPGNLRVPFPHVDNSRSQEQNKAEMQRSLDLLEECFSNYRDEIVAVIVEPIQGAGGQRVADPEFFRCLSSLTHEYDIYLGFDEVQTAGGQTGTMFAIDQFGLPYPPQAVAVAKKFGNGAVYMLHPMEDHGVLDSTWGGCLSDMVRVVQEMKIVKEEKLIEQVPAKSEVLVTGLNELASQFDDLIFNIRGMGLYQGFSLRKVENRSKLQKIALHEEGLLLLGAGTQTIRLRPALDVTTDEVKVMLDRLKKSLKTLRGQLNSNA